MFTFLALKEIAGEHNSIIEPWSRMTDKQLGKQLGFSWTKQKCVKNGTFSKCELISTLRSLNTLYSEDLCVQ
jgi:hypothetical protein